MDKELFEAQAKTNAVYEYKYKDLIAIVPKTPEDIVEEATRQRNCLRSYVERVKNGQTVVVFIRKKDEPEMHGIGIKNIIQIVEKYNGEYVIKNENNEFSFSIIIPL